MAKICNNVDDVVPLSRKCAPEDTCQTGNPDDTFNICAAKLQDDHYLTVSWIEWYSAEDIAVMQREDRHLYCQNLAREGREPNKVTTTNAHMESPAFRALWLFREFLHIKNSVLYYEWIDKVVRKFCLVVPSCLKTRVLIFVMIPGLQDIWVSRKYTTEINIHSTGIIFHTMVQSISKGALPVIKIRSLISNLKVPLCLIMQDFIWKGSFRHFPSV